MQLCTHENCKDYNKAITQNCIDCDGDSKYEPKPEEAQADEQISSVIGSSDVRISDLLDIIHYTVIKKLGKNDVLLKEVQAMEWKIKHSGEMENFSVEDTEFWKSILNRRNCR